MEKEYNYITRMADKTYAFTVSHGPDAVETVYKTEQELDQKDKDLMLSTAIYEFNKLPDDIKFDFLERTVHAMRLYYAEETARHMPSDAFKD